MISPRSFLRWYDEFSDEHHPESLADYYVAFRALIRSKVACVRYRQGDRAAADEARQLLELAARHLRQRPGHARPRRRHARDRGSRPSPRGIGDARGWTVLRSDVVRKELAGLPPHEPTPQPSCGQGLYTDAASRATYDELLRRARRALELG